jgi:hypothetical protein
MSNDKRVYLGDSVYYENEVGRGRVVLATNNGVGDSNVIYLEHDVIVSLLRQLGADFGRDKIAAIVRTER